MKPGERAPPGVRELVVRLAGSAPRPTNREIASAVLRKFEVRIADRTIARYCRDAAVPTSSKGRRLEARATFHTGVNPHRERLLHFGRRLRDRLVLERVDRVVEAALSGDEVAPWRGLAGQGVDVQPEEEEEREVEEAWGVGERSNATSHPLYSAFKGHVRDRKLWNTLQLVRAGMAEHQEACIAAYQAIEGQADDALAALAPEQRHALVVWCLVDAWNRHRNGVGLIAAREPERTGHEWRVDLGARAIGVGSEAVARRLVKARDALGEVAATSPTLAALASADAEAWKRINAFRALLEPDDRLRKLLADTVCHLCR